MNDTRILQKVPGAIGRYHFGAFKFNASCDQHAERMKAAFLKNEAERDKSSQADPLTPQQRLKFEADPNTNPDVEARAVLAGFAKRNGEIVETKKKAKPKKKEKTA